MSPGINDHPHPRYTGALPKSNRRSDRNRNRDKATVNQDCSSPGRGYSSHASMRANNMFQRCQSPTVTEHQVSNPQVSCSRIKKNSNNSTRSYSSAGDQTPSAYAFAEFVPYNSHSSRVHPNIYEDLIPWLKMTPPVELQTQSPPDLPAKTTNTDRMPERAQVEGRLNQIREYIKVTSTMMDSLSQSSDPRAQTQREKLSRMVEDLYDSETKLSKLMEDCQKYWTLDENGDLDNEDRRREIELRKKVEESQRKLAQLQEHQAHLVGMQLQVRERLDKARQAQQALLVDDENENENDHEDVNIVEVDEGAIPNESNVERLERETEALRDKLQQLESKKRKMDRLVQELQTVDMNDRASCSSEGSRTMTGQRDKQAELDAMKAQLKHLKALMKEATRCRGDSLDAQAGSDSEHQDDGNDAVNDEVYQVVENAASSFFNSFNDVDETIAPKAPGEQLTVEQIQDVTRKMKEQQLLLQNARAELLRIKQLRTNSSCQSNPTPQASQAPVINSTPPPAEIKQSNNDARRNKRRQIEEFVKKEQSQAINQNGSQEWGSRRGSTSQHSNTSTPGNLWPPPTNSTNGMSTAENLLGMDEQTPLENGFANNFWAMPSMLGNQPSQVPGVAMGSAEYYRQLLLGSQAQQLQMMSATMQQCCQLLWSQQREIQSLKTAVIQLQNQLRQSQLRTSNNLDLQEEHHSNLVRPATQQQFSTLDGAPLPPSSSLPNLVSLPGGTSPAPLPVIPTIANCQQQQQQQQLNNQVPPGNRANNYWDNFRSYSRQNLLSGSSKATSECASSSTVHATSSTHTASGTMNSSHMNNKRNRPQSENQASSHNLQQDRESVISARNNYVSSNDVSLQHPPPIQQNEGANEEVAGALCESRQFEDQASARIAKNISERDDLRQILIHCLKVLETRQQNESPLPSSNISNSSESSDDESEAEARGTSNIPTVENVIVENQASNADYVDAGALAQSSESAASQYYCEPVEFSDAISYDNTVYPMPLVSSSNPTHEVAEADEGLNQGFNNESSAAGESEGVAVVSSSVNLDNSEVSLDDINIEDEPERLEYVMLDNSQNTASNQLPQTDRPQTIFNSHNPRDCISCALNRLNK